MELLPSLHYAHDTLPAELDKGSLPDFLLGNKKYIRENDVWKGAPPAPGLFERANATTCANMRE